ncbi:CBS domain-containing protein [Halorientalis brevis]|uniref:CBS domain-containing protein n=1 Tax=Halorientalis brevis TaxID=1126241 RepID=A0ABD6CI44_9EURY|nr:CBS domain-containing protein [Halorientalis brevis]
MAVSVPVRDIMSTTVRTTEPGATAHDAATILREAAVGSVVVAEANEPIGILTETDVVDVVQANDDPNAVTVQAVMRPDPITVDPDATVRDVASLMRTDGVKRLPVVEDGDLVGVVTTTDVAAFYPRTARAVQADGGATATSPGTRGTAYHAENWEFSDDGDLPETVEVGETFRFEKTLSEADVEAFAQASGDTNRLHLDEEFAARSRFGRRIAHGMLVAGVISATLARLPGTVIYLSQTTDFVGPVDIGERVRAAVTAVEALRKDRWRLETTVLDSDDEPVVEGEAVVLVDESANE